MEQLADDVTFNSPVATYHGRPDVEHLLTIISGVVYSYREERELTRPGGEIVTFVTGKIGGHEIHGVIDRFVNEDGQITELTLMLRPLKALMAAVEQMAQALSASPLPSARN